MEQREFRPVDAHVLAALLGQVRSMVTRDGAYDIGPITPWAEQIVVSLAEGAFRETFAEWTIMPRESEFFPYVAVVNLGPVRFERLIHHSDVSAWLPAVPATA